MPDSSTKVLIVDDEAALMGALCDTLQSEGYHATGFTSAGQALAALQEQSFDLILTDLMMPEMDGISVLDAAFKIDPNLVGIVMTGHGAVNTAVSALKTGAVDYILKPFKLNAILAVLTRALAVRRLRMENIQLREAERLHEVSMTIASARDSDAIVQIVAEAAFDQSKASSLSVLLLVEAEGAVSGQSPAEDLHVAAVRGATMDHLVGRRVAFSTEMQKWASGCGESPRDFDSLSRKGPIPGIPGTLSVPMRSGDRLVGILHFEQSGTVRGFTPGQQKALSILASTGASALAATMGMERLRTAEERYRLLAEDAPDVVSRYELLPMLRCTYMNPAVMQVTGHSPEEFYAEPDLALRITHPEDQGMAEKALSGELPPGRAVILRWMSKKNQVVWVEQRSTPVRDHHGMLVAIEIVSRDISERKNLEEQLRHSQKLEAIGRLTAGVAHDFNNLLTIINGYCALALAEVAPAGPTWLKLEEIRKGGEQAASMTNKLLAFSRKQVLQPRPINLIALLDEMAQMIASTAGDLVRVSVRKPPGLGNVKIDPTQAYQVVLNLAVNAKDAMPGGGTLDFELRNVDSEEVRARVPDIAPGSYVMLTVADTGCGMTPETMQHVFEPFFTTKELGRGTGLGLATVHGIVQQSGGYVSIESELGKGTKFLILLPRCDEAAEPVRHDMQDASKGNETILLVEDNPGVRAFATEVLTKAGYLVLAAPDGEAALRLAAGHAGAINLLITDMRLPKMPGSGVAEQIRGVLPQIKILFMSGYSEVAPPQLDATSPEFLVKPFTPAELSIKVRTILNSGVARRVLVVDDEKPIRSLLKEILEGEGFEVLTAANGREAMRMLVDSTVDYVITDLIMPEMEGIEFISQIRKERPNIKLIATTGGGGVAFGAAQFDFLTAARMLGSHATLPKPLTPRSVISCIRELAAV